MFLTACRFAGMAAYTVIRRKMKSVLFIAIGVITHPRLFIDEHFPTSGQGAAGTGNKVDGRLVVIYLWACWLLKKGITGFIVSNFPHI
ncbi:MAG: hypothetical protein ACI8RU_001471 [Zhongshania aliphaticivorans]